MRFGASALRMKFSPSYRVPLTINILLLNRCSFSCLYCQQDHQDPTMVPLDKLLSVLREAKTLGTQRIHLTGGEPLLHPDIGEIIRVGKEMGFFVSLTSNGLLVDAFIEDVKRLDQLQISLDGPPQVREYLCGPLAVPAIDRAFAALKQEGIRFWTNTVLTKATIPHIEWIVEQARENKAQANFVVMEAHPEAWTPDRPMPEAMKNLFPTEEENREALRTLIRLKKQGRPIGSSLSYLRELLEWEDYAKNYSSKKSRRYRCMAWQSQCELFPDGNIHLCPHTWETDRGISIYTHSFREAWERLPRPENCNSCYLSCYLESNLIFSLNIPTLWNWVKKLI